MEIIVLEDLEGRILHEEAFPDNVPPEIRINQIRNERAVFGFNGRPPEIYQISFFRTDECVPASDGKLMATIYRQRELPEMETT